MARQWGLWLAALVLAGSFLFNKGYADSGLVSADVSDAGSKSSSSEVLIKEEEPEKWGIKYPVLDSDRGGVVEAPFVHTPRKTAGEIRKLSEYPPHLLYLYLTGLAPRESLEELEKSEKGLLAKTISSYSDEGGESKLLSGLFDGYKERFRVERVGEKPNIRDLAALVDVIATERVFGESSVANFLAETSSVLADLANLKFSVRFDDIFRRGSNKRKNNDGRRGSGSWDITRYPRLSVGFKGIDLDLLRAENMSSILEIGIDVKP